MTDLHALDEAVQRRWWTVRQWCLDGDRVLGVPEHVAAVVRGEYRLIVAERAKQAALAVALRAFGAEEKVNGT